MAIITPRFGGTLELQGEELDLSPSLASLPLPSDEVEVSLPVFTTSLTPVDWWVIHLRMVEPSTGSARWNGTGSIRGKLREFPGAEPARLKWYSVTDDNIPGNPDIVRARFDNEGQLLLAVPLPEVLSITLRFSKGTQPGTLEGYAGFVRGTPPFLTG